VASRVFDLNRALRSTREEAFLPASITCFGSPPSRSNTVVGFATLSFFFRDPTIKHLDQCHIN
jgi:hypothetical protein